MTKKRRLDSLDGRNKGLNKYMLYKEILEKQIAAIKKNADRSCLIGSAGVGVGVGALAVAVVNACQNHMDAATICMLTGVFSTVVGGMNLSNAKILNAKLHALRTRKHIEEKAAKSHEH